MNAIAALFGTRLARYVARLGAGMLVAAMARRLEERRAMANAAGPNGAGRRGRRVPDVVMTAIPGATLVVLKAVIDRSGPRMARRRR